MIDFITIFKALKHYTSRANLKSTVFLQLKESI